MHHPTSPRDPFLALDHRWRAARACVEQGRPPAACDDRWVGEAVRYLAERGERPGPGDLARLAEQMPAVSQAFDLHQADPPGFRWAVEARLLAGEPFDGIARKCALLPGAVEMYERLFFAVVDMLGFDTWVVCQAIGPKAFRGMTEQDVDVWWKLLGYCFGPLVLDQAIDHSAGLPRPAEDGQLAAALDHGAEALFRAKKLLAAHLLPVTPETAPQVLQLAAQLEAAGDRPADSAAPQQGTADCLLGGLAAAPGAAEGGTGPHPQATGPVDPPVGWDGLLEDTGPGADPLGAGPAGRPGPARPTSSRARRVAV
jgi:hypothetical protein